MQNHPLRQRSPSRGLSPDQLDRRLPGDTAELLAVATLERLRPQYRKYLVAGSDERTGAADRNRHKVKSGTRKPYDPATYANRLNQSPLRKSTSPSRLSRSGLLTTDERRNTNNTNITIHNYDRPSQPSQPSLPSRYGANNSPLRSSKSGTDFYYLSKGTTT